MLPPVDEQISERGLRKGLPPTGISYAEFVGMRPRTMSQLPFRKDGKLTIIRDDRQEHYPEPEKGEKGGKKGRVKERASCPYKWLASKMSTHSN